jgi:deoxyribose-phosphate aldolase
MDYTALSRNIPNNVYNTELAAMIDHTLLKANAAAPQIKELCQQACDYGFASVCVNPFWVPLACQLLTASPVKVCTVIGFPLGATSTASKVYETSVALEAGAAEVDMVLNVGALKSGKARPVKDDIARVVRAARGRALVKVILETCYLSDQEKIAACELAKAAGADFLKTSTGFGPGGATVADIALMRRTVGPETGVKASGGIRDYETAIAMVKAGATRIGASASIAIVGGQNTTLSGS